MQNTTQTTEQIARDRVANSAALTAYSETIFSDWENANEHFEWVANAPESEIVEWAKEVEQSA